jgi:hypothetical protein
MVGTNDIGPGPVTGLFIRKMIKYPRRGRADPRNEPPELNDGGVTFRLFGEIIQAGVTDDEKEGHAKPVKVYMGLSQ